MSKSVVPRTLPCCTSFLVLKWLKRKHSWNWYMDTASVPISCILKWSGTCSSDNGFMFTASLHISCVLYQSGTYTNDSYPSSTASLHIFLVLKWSGTNCNDQGYSLTAPLQISCVLYQSGTYANEYSPIRTASLHVSCVLRWSGTFIIKSGIISCGILLSKIIFIYIFTPGEGQNMGWGGDFISDNFKTIVFYFHNFLPSPDMHQAIVRLGCQAMGKKSSLIFAFWALRFW